MSVIFCNLSPNIIQAFLIRESVRIMQFYFMCAFLTETSEQKISV